MKFLVKEIKFDFDEGDIDDPITFEEQVQIIHDNLGVWEASDEDELCSAPTFKNGETDYEMWDYVSEWEDLEGVNLDALLNIHKRLVVDLVANQVYQGA